MGLEDFDVHVDYDAAWRRELGGALAELNELINELTESGKRGKALALKAAASDHLYTTIATSAFDHLRRPPTPGAGGG